MIERQRQYNSLQEEVDEQRKIIRKLRQKYKQAESELQAVTRDQDDARLELTDTIREQEKDLDFLNAIVGMMLKDGEMYRLKEKIEYDFEAGKWKVPPFLVKAKEVAFPRIKNAMGLVRDELDQREVVLADTGEVLSDGSSGGAGSKYGQNGIQPSFKGSAQGGARARKRIDKYASGVSTDGAADSAGYLKVQQPLNNGRSKNGGGRNLGSMEEVGGQRFNGDYYVTGRNTNEYVSSSSSARDLGADGGQKFGAKNSGQGNGS